MQNYKHTYLNCKFIWVLRRLDSIIFWLKNKSYLVTIKWTSLSKFPIEAFIEKKTRITSVLLVDRWWKHKYKYLHGKEKKTKKTFVCIYYISSIYLPINNNNY